MKLLGIAGKKQSGKNSSANYLSGYVLKKYNQISDYRMTENGQLNVLTEYADGNEDWGILDLERKDPEFISAARETIWPFVKCYSYADSLKRAAVDLFELKPEQVWGTDEQKNSPTHLMWENMPGITVDIDQVLQLEKWYKERFDYHGPCTSLVHHNPGPMTGREFLQFLGTEVGRKMYPPIWINSTIRNIQREQSELAIITDVRFPDEVDAIHKAGGVVFKLTRQVSDDDHPSENSLNEDVYDWDQFDAVVHNQDLNLAETFEKIKVLSQSFGLV